MLFVIARDNENEAIAQEIRTRFPDTLIGLAPLAVTQGEPDARWQLADQLGRIASPNSSVDSSLLAFAEDEHEYVRRRALMALARRGSPAVEELARRAWTLPVEEQEYSRMAALWSLHRIDSPILGPLLDEAERDHRQYLSAYARKVRRGEVDL
ncbi:MAG: HEAT repeat domain-containing protein [Planctomycetia bacterium]|nr:HEAT repeat domain-containing protein [Planctomycetia bacterium]